MKSTTLPRRTLIPDDERRAPVGLTEADRCRRCQGPILRTDTVGLCWSCMPTA